MAYSVALIPGDGIGAEVTDAAVAKALRCSMQVHGGCWQGRRDEGGPPGPAGACRTR